MVAKKERAYKYWYKIIIDDCYGCGASVTRKRITDKPRPKLRKDRIEYSITMCYGCQYTMFM